MNLRVQMIDTDTGEILGSKYTNYALNFGCKNDAGFGFLMRWIQSSVRGIRVAKHKSIELRIHFSEEKESLSLPFGMSVEDSKEIAQSYVY